MNSIGQPLKTWFNVVETNATQPLKTYLTFVYNPKYEM